MTATPMTVRTAIMAWVMTGTTTGATTAVGGNKYIKNSTGGFSACGVAKRLIKLEPS